MTKRPPNGTRRVTFHLPAESGAAAGCVCGDFNDWMPGTTRLRRRRDGSLATTVVLETGRSYRYRFLLDDGRWENDWAAHAYVPNAYGTEDSVIHVA